MTTAPTIEIVPYQEWVTTARRSIGKNSSFRNRTARGTRIFMCAQRARPTRGYALLFRDLLRASPPAAKNYENLKRALATLTSHDIDAYLSVKEPAFGLIMLAAEEWAKRARWEPEPSDV